MTSLTKLVRDLQKKGHMIVLMLDANATIANDQALKQLSMLQCE
jgi:hypothetical protein